MNDRDNEAIYVPKKHIGLIIGKGGATIKEISNDAGCRINISKDEVVNDEVKVTFEGNSRNVEDAKTKINEIIRRQQKRHQPDGEDNRYGNNDNDNYNNSGNNFSSKRPSRRDDDDNHNRKSSNDRNYSRNGDDNRSFSKSSNDRDYSRNSNSNNGYSSYSNNSQNGNDKYNNDNSWSRGRTDNQRQPVNDDQWGGWGSKTREQDTVDSLIFKDDDFSRGNTKFLQKSADNYVPDDDWGIPSYIEDETPVRKRPANAQLKMRSTKDKTFFQVLRNFYQEHPNVSAMSVEEKDKFLVDKNNIMIKEIDTDKDSYCNFGGGLEDDPEDKVELIPVAKVIPNPVRSFDEAFYRYPDILKEIRKQKFQEPSPIQCIGWPILMSGRDLIGIAQTGTGKTLAFLLPAFIHIEGQPKPRENRQGPTVLILSPTRELAIQIQKEVQKYTYHDIDSVVCYGGADKREQINQLRENPEIVVGTPGRILDLKDSGMLNLKDVSYLVLDEADRMLDMGFEIQVVNIIYSVRKQRQTVMTSATWPFSVQRIALNHMKDPIQVNVGTLDLNACHSVTQKVEYVEYEAKNRRLVEILSEITPDDKIIIFVARKAQCSDLAYELHEKRSKGLLGPKGAVRACEIHGDLDQSERELALRMMRSGARNVLIATDVASRGLDIPDLTKVINFDFPKNIEEYVHRVGRTGRAGRSGLSITFMNKRDWSGVADLIKILEDADQEVPEFLRPLMKQYQEFRINGGSRGRFGGGGGRGGGGRFGGGGGGGRGGGGRGRGGNRDRDNDDDGGFFGRGYEADDVRSDSSCYTDTESIEISVSSLSLSSMMSKKVNCDESANDDEDNWGTWNKQLPEQFVAESIQFQPRYVDVFESSQTTRQESVTICNTSNNPYIIANKDRNMYPIIRNFYEVHPSIMHSNVEDMDQSFSQKYNLVIEEIKTYPAQFNIDDEDDDDDDHFDEGKLELKPAIIGIPKTIKTFEDAFWQYPVIVEMRQQLNCDKLTPIQRIGWPTLLGGRDFIDVTKSESGQRLTYILPSLIHIDGQTKERKFRKGPTALMITATNGLVKQIESELKKIQYKDIGNLCCLDGGNMMSYVKRLRENPEIVVGCPRVLCDLMDMGQMCVSDVSYLVLDHIDDIMTMGLEMYMTKIIYRTRRQRQTCMTSVKWPECVRMIASMYMNNPVLVTISPRRVIACKNVIQELQHVENCHKTAVLCDIISSMTMFDKIVVFVTRRRQCRSLVSILEPMMRAHQLGLYASVCEIHGDIASDTVTEMMGLFYDGRYNVAISTNMVARDLDLSLVTSVINYDMPATIDQYVQRVSAMGRMNSRGKVVTFVNDIDWQVAPELIAVLRQSEQPVPEWLTRLRSMRVEVRADNEFEGESGYRGPIVEETVVQYHEDCWREMFDDDDNCYW